MINSQLKTKLGLICKSLLIGCMFTASNIAYAQVIINEFQAINKNSFLLKVAWDDTYPDWIELKNTSNSPIDISGYYLSDNIAIPNKWAVPSGVTIPAKGFVLFFATGTNTGMHTNFKLSGTGEDVILSKPDLTVVDQISYGVQYEDLSYGRKADATWAYFNTATPGAENNDLSSFPGYLTGPMFSIESGLYNSPQSISITADAGTNIYYTLNGSKPSASSTLYTGPISISSTTVLKAIALKGTETSLIEASSYVFGASHTLPVIFLSSVNDRALWVTNQVGKYDMDGRIRFEYLEPGGKKALNQYANFRISGKTSRAMPQLNGKVTPRFEKGAFNYSFFPNKNIRKNQGFLLRNASQDYKFAHMRDALLARIIGKDDISDGFYFEGYRAAVLYVDGVFDGVIHIREDDDNKYLENNFPGMEVSQVMTQDFSLGTKAFNYSNPADRLAQKELINIHDALTFYHVHFFFQAGEWETVQQVDVPGRVPRKVHYIHDIDYGLGITNEDYHSPRVTAVSKGMYDFPSNILANNDYKQEAAQFSCAMYNFVLDSTRVNGLVDEIKNSYLGEMTAHAEVGIRTAALRPLTPGFGKPTYKNEAEWLLNVDTLKMWVSQVNNGIFDWMKTNYGYSDYVDIQFQTSSAAHGHIRVHGIKVVEDDMRGNFFSNIPLNLEAKPLPGYEFSHWEGDVSGPDAKISPTFNVNSRVKAVFVPITYVAHKLHINEVQSVNNTTIADEFGEFNDWIEIYNMDGVAVDLAGYYVSDDTCNLRKWRIKSDDPSKTTVASGDWIILWADKDTLQGPNHLNFKLNNPEMFILTYPNGITIVDSISFNLNPDESKGSEVDGSSTDVIFNVPTPGASNNPLVTNTNKITKAHLIIAPNPANEEIKILGDYKNEMLTISVFSSQGIEVLKEQRNRGGNTVDISGLKPGVYFIQLFDGSDYFNSSFVKI